jgi:benzoate/toluate 1,2-dioxygenase subunit beta
VTAGGNSSEAATPAAEPLTEAGGIALAEAEQFLYREARLADEHRYDDWEALWTDDAIYWVPANGELGADPDTSMSIIFDNRSRIGTRIKQFHTGKRHSQAPPSNLRRVVSNIELLGEADGDAKVVASFMCFESRDRGLTIWAGRLDYRLRRAEDGIRMAYKQVTLVDNDRPVNTLSFLI